MIDTRPRLLLIEDDPKLGPVMQQVLDEVYSVTLVIDGAAGVTEALANDYEAARAKRTRRKYLQPMLLEQAHLHLAGTSNVSGSTNIGS